MQFFTKFCRKGFFHSHKNADFAGKSEYGRENGYDDYLYVVETFNKIVDEEQCTCSAELNITGKEMIAMGVKPGPKIGDIFDRLLDMVLENPQLNENEKLIVNINDQDVKIE